MLKCGKVGLWQCISAVSVSHSFFKPTISYISFIFHIGFDFYGKGPQKLLVLESLVFSNNLQPLSSMQKEAEVVFEVNKVNTVNKD